MIGAAELLDSRNISVYQGYYIPSQAVYTNSGKNKMDTSHVRGYRQLRHWPATEDSERTGMNNP